MTVHLIKRNKQHVHLRIKTCQIRIVKNCVYVNVKNPISNHWFGGFEATSHALLLYHTFDIVWEIMTGVKVMMGCKGIDYWWVPVMVSFEIERYFDWI